MRHVLITTPNMTGRKARQVVSMEDLAMDDEQLDKLIARGWAIEFVNEDAEVVGDEMVRLAGITDGFSTDPELASQLGLEFVDGKEARERLGLDESFGLDEELADGESDSEPA